MSKGRTLVPLSATAGIGRHVSLQATRGASSPPSARSRKARVPSAVACFTYGLSVTPPVRGRSVKMLCDPPRKTASAFLGNPTASNTSRPSCTGEYRPGSWTSSSVAVTCVLRKVNAVFESS